MSSNSLSSHAPDEASLPQFITRTSFPSLQSGPHFSPSVSFLTLVSCISVSLLPGYSGPPLCSSPMNPPNRLRYVSREHLLVDAPTAAHSRLLQKRRRQQTTWRSRLLAVQNHLSRCDTKFNVSASRAVSQCAGWEGWGGFTSQA